MADGNTPEQRALDMRVLLKKLGVKRRVLVGWSQGVQDVAAYVGRFGTTDIEGIILVDSTISGGAGAIGKAPATAQRQLGRLPAYVDDPRGYTAGMIRAIISRSLEPGTLDRLVDDALKTPTATGVAMLVADMFGADRTPTLARFNVPTLVIASGRSTELEQQRATAAVLRAKFVVVDDAAHAVFVDQPGRFNSLVEDFLIAVEAGR